MFRKDRNDKRGSSKSGKPTRGVRNSEGGTERPRSLNTNRRDWNSKDSSSKDTGRFRRTTSEDNKWGGDSERSKSRNFSSDNSSSFKSRNDRFSSNEEKRGDKRSFDRRDDNRSSRGDGDKRSFNRRDDNRFSRGDSDKRSFDRRDDNRFSRGDSDKRSFDRRDDNRFSRGDGDKRSFDRRDDNRFSRGDDNKRSFDRRDDNRFSKRDGDNRNERYSNDRREGFKSFDGNKRYQDNDRKSSFGDDRRKPNDFDRNRNQDNSKRPYSSDSREGSDGRKRTRKLLNEDQQLIGNWRKDAPNRDGFPKERAERNIKSGFKVNTDTDLIRLNKFLANAGLCSRREADDFILNGSVTVNGTVINELGYKIDPKDEVRFKGRLILPEKPVYIVMNKPKDVITTSDDPDGRKIITDLIRNEVKERVFPVGRLDRNTTGVILLTNDGDLSQKLTHPSYEIHKVYMATLDKPLTQPDFDTLFGGVELEDGPIQPDALAWLDESKMNIGVEIHSGKNRIIHRMFNHLGYMVDKLDRVAFAGITKDGLRRGEFRFLSEHDLMTLRKNIGKSKKN